MNLISALLFFCLIHWRTIKFVWEENVLFSTLNNECFAGELSSAASLFSSVNLNLSTDISHNNNNLWFVLANIIREICVQELSNFFFRRGSSNEQQSKTENECEGETEVLYVKLLCAVIHAINKILMKLKKKAIMCASHPY